MAQRRLAGKVRTAADPTLLAWDGGVLLDPARAAQRQAGPDEPRSYHLVGHALLVAARGTGRGQAAAAAVEVLRRDQRHRSSSRTPFRRWKRRDRSAITNGNRWIGRSRAPIWPVRMSVSVYRSAQDHDGQMGARAWVICARRSHCIARRSWNCRPVIGIRSRETLLSPRRCCDACPGIRTRRWAWSGRRRATQSRIGPGRKPSSTISRGSGCR